MSAPNPTLKQQKVFAVMQIIGGMVAGGVAGFSCLLNVYAGASLWQGETLALALMTFASLGYAGYYTQKFSKLVQPPQ